MIELFTTAARPATSRSAFGVRHDALPSESSTMSKVLVVDDEPSAAHWIAQVLLTRGHDSVLAFDGEEALDLLSTGDFDLVITDLAMPKFNGLRLIRTIRSGGDTLPIIALSGKNADQLMLAEDYGANAAIAKPLDPERLLALVSKIIDDSRARWSSAWIHPEFGSVEER